MSINISIGGNSARDENNVPSIGFASENNSFVPVSAKNPLPVQIITTTDNTNTKNLKNEILAEVDNKISEITKNPDNQDFEEKILFAETEEKNGKLIFKKINENIFSLKKSTEEYLSDVVYAKAGVYYVNCYLYAELGDRLERYDDEYLKDLFYISNRVGDDIDPEMKFFVGSLEAYEGKPNAPQGTGTVVYYYRNTVLHTDESKPLFENIITGDPIAELKQGLTIVKIA